MFRIESDFGGGSTCSITASDDYGQNWYEYSDLPSPMRRFTPLVVQSKSSCDVYLMAGLRVFPQDPGVEWWATMEVWRSSDRMKTLQLVTDNPGFGLTSPSSRGAATGDEGTLYYFKGLESTLFEIWKSTNRGLSWTMTRSRDAPRVAVDQKSVQYFNGQLYAIGEIYNALDSNRWGLIRSADEGKTWSTCPVKFIPKAILKDPKLNRLIFLTVVSMYVLDGVSGKFGLLRNDLCSPINAASSKEILGRCTPQACLFANGAMLLTLYPPLVPFLFMSFPAKILTARDKKLLANFLDSLGIHSLLFQENISPFLFPY